MRHVVQSNGFNTLRLHVGWQFLTNDEESGKLSSTNFLFTSPRRFVTLYPWFHRRQVHRDHTLASSNEIPAAALLPCRPPSRRQLLPLHLSTPNRGPSTTRGNCVYDFLGVVVFNLLSTASPVSSLTFAEPAPITAAPVGKMDEGPGGDDDWKNTNNSMTIKRPSLDPPGRTFLSSRLCDRPGV
jgi:hypothetical protein